VQIVLRLVPKQKESKINFKSQLKCCESLSVHGQLAKLGLQMNSSQQQFLNKGKKASVKNPNTEADPVPFALFGQNSNSPPLGTQRAFGVFSKFKKRRF
jgi:hypothetical protein